MIYRLKDLFFEYTPTEPAISPFKPINRPPKTDRYKGTTQTISLIKQATSTKAYKTNLKK